MRQIFTKDTLKHSVKPILIILLACAFVFYWGRYRKVSINMTLRPDVEAVGGDEPQKLDLSLYDSTESLSASITQNISSRELSSVQLNLRPGNYTMRGTITLTSGKTRIVEQYITVPDNDASMEIFLRRPK